MKDTDTVNKKPRILSKLFIFLIGIFVGGVLLLLLSFILSPKTHSKVKIKRIDLEQANYLIENSDETFYLILDIPNCDHCEAMKKEFTKTLSKENISFKVFEVDILKHRNHYSDEEAAKYGFEKSLATIETIDGIDYLVQSEAFQTFMNYLSILKFEDETFNFPWTKKSTSSEDINLSLNGVLYKDKAPWIYALSIIKVVNNKVIAMIGGDIVHYKDKHYLFKQLIYSPYSPFPLYILKQ